ncbi:MAG: hypothetical protein R3B47_09185 [Bacteroidia bacterium]
MFHAIFIGTYLFLFYAIISRLSKGLEGSLSINVRGILTVTAVLLIGWPVLLMQQAGAGAFSQWHTGFPMLWLAVGVPMVLGARLMLFEVFRKAGKALSAVNFIWPLASHFALAAGFWGLNRLQKSTDPASIWIFLQESIS